MQNEFEKQVQQKLGELDLVPTAPVWQNIEKQIRKDKERRRVIFWLPVGVLFLLGVGAWFWISGDDNAVPKPETAQTNEQRTEAPKENGVHEEANKELSSNPAETEVTNSSKQNSKETATVTLSKNNTAAPIIKEQNQIKKSEQNSIVQQEPKVGKPIETGSGVEQKQARSEINTENKVVVTGILSGEKRTTVDDQPSVSSPAISKTDSSKKKDTVVKDVVILDQPNEAARGSNASSKKWKLGLMGGLGFSGEGTGIDLNTEKSMDQLSNGSAQAPPMQSSSKPGTPVNKEFSFSIGMSVKKELSNRFSLVSGLTLNYYSSSRDVGEQMQDSTLPAGIFISRFYLNTGQVANNVTSRYYFVSLPLMVDWRFISSESFHLQAGISIQQLISSNAIQYDPQKGIYYKDPSSLKKTQMFTSFNLGYEFSFKNKGSLMIGPSIQYGLNELSEKENKHLFFAGINAQYFFK